MRDVRSDRADRVRSDLEDVSRLLAVTADVPAWSPEWIADEGLRQRQAELSHELELLEVGAGLQVRFIGGAERNNEIDAHFLSEFIQELQQTLGSLVQTLTHGEQPMGPFPADVAAQSRMRAAPSTAGSYVLHLSGPDRRIQLSMETEDDRPPFDEAVDRVLDLVDAAQSEEGFDAVEAAIAEFRSPRAINHLAELTKALARTQTTAHFVERSPFTDRPREAGMTIAAATRLQRVLSRTEKSTETEVITGLLSGVRWRSGIFDLEFDLAGEAAFVSGRVRADLRPAISSLFDRMVHATLERTTIRTGKTAVPRQTYLLVGVRLADEDTPWG